MNSYEKSSVQHMIDNLRPIDDTMFCLLASDKAVCQEILRTLLQDKELTVIENIPQERIVNLKREIVLDVLCRLGNGTLCNIEVQKGNSNDDIKRVRFHASSITANKTEKGTKFKDVPDVKIIYITEYDALKNQRTVTRVKRCMETENGYIPIADGEEIIFANTQIKSKTEEGELLQLFLENNTFQHKKFPKLSEAINYYKIEERGREKMCELVEQYAKDYAEQKEKQTVINLLKNGASIDLIVASTSFDRKTVEELDEQLKNNG